MNFVQRFLNYLSPSNTGIKVLPNSRKDWLSERYQQKIGSFNYTYPEYCSTVYTCVSIISNNIAKLRPHVYLTSVKGREIASAHPWESVLSINPDLRLSTSKWLHHGVTKQLIEGTSYHYISEFEGLEVKRELKPLCNLERVVHYDNDVWYKFKEIEPYIPSKKLLINYSFSRDGITGISPVCALKNEIGIQHGAEETINNFFKNGLFQILFMETDLEGLGIADKNKANEFFKKIEAEIAGSRNAFGGGVMQIPPLYKLKSIPLPDLKFLESSKFSESRIAAAYNLPGWMLNINEGASVAGKTEAQQLHFLNNCLSSIINGWKSELTYKLLTTDEIKQGYSIDFDLSGLFDVDLESKSIYYKNLQSIGAVSPNEVRHAFNFPIVDNEYMNMHFIQSQNQAIEQYPYWKVPQAPGQQGTENNNTNE